MGREGVNVKGEKEERSFLTGGVVMYTHTHTCIHTCIHVHAQTHTHVYIHIYMMYMYINIHVNACTHTHTIHMVDGWRLIDGGRTEGYIYLHKYTCL
jgi:hypothetical protein